MQVARVVLVHVILIDGLGVIVDVLISHDKVLVIYVAIFVVIFCIWRCTLYKFSRKWSLKYCFCTPTSMTKLQLLTWQAARRLCFLVASDMTASVCG